MKPLSDFFIENVFTQSPARSLRLAKSNSLLERRIDAQFAHRHTMIEHDQSCCQLNSKTVVFERKYSVFHGAKRCLALRAG